MLRSWKFWAVMIGIFSVIGIFIFGFTTDPKLVKSPLIGKPAPGFSITRLDGTEVLSLRQLRGKPVVLNFWASWCVACRDEAHLLQAAHNIYEKQQGKLRMVGIAIQDEKAKAIAFAKKFGKTYFLALDNEAGDISLSYGLYGVPETFFIDAAGIIRFKQIGAVTAEVIRDQVAALLAKPERAQQ